MVSKLGIGRILPIVNTVDILSYAINNLGYRNSNICEKVTRNALISQRLKFLESKDLLMIDRASGANVSFLNLTDKRKRFIALLIETESLIDYRSNTGTPNSTRSDYTSSDLTQNELCW